MFAVWILARRDLIAEVYKKTRSHEECYVKGATLPLLHFKFMYDIVASQRPLSVDYDLPKPRSHWFVGLIAAGRGGFPSINPS